MGHKRILRRTDDLKILEFYAQGKTQKEIGEVFGVTDVAICLRLKKLLPLVKAVKEKRFLSREPIDMQMLQDLKNANNVQEEPQTQEPVPCPEHTNDNSIALPEHNDNTVVDVEPEEDKELGDLMSACGLSKKYRLQRLKRCMDHPDPGVVLKALDQSWKLDGSYPTIKI